jgi:hypothetical protein
MFPFLNGDAKVGISFILSKELQKNFGNTLNILAQKRSRP